MKNRRVGSHGSAKSAGKQLPIEWLQPENAEPVKPKVTRKSGWHELPPVKISEKLLEDVKAYAQLKGESFPRCLAEVIWAGFMFLHSLDQAQPSKQDRRNLVCQPGNPLN